MVRLSNLRELVAVYGEEFREPIKCEVRAWLVSCGSFMLALRELGDITVWRDALTEETWKTSSITQSRRALGHNRQLAGEGTWAALENSAQTKAHWSLGANQF